MGAEKKNTPKPISDITKAILRHLAIMDLGLALFSEMSRVAAKPVPDDAKVIPNVKTENII